MDSYLFFTALGVVIILSPTYLLLKKHKQSTQKALFLLGLGLVLLIIFSKAFGALGYYLFTKELSFAPTSIMGLLCFVIFFAKPWAIKNKQMGSELLLLWSYLLPFSQSIGRLGCFFAGCCFIRNPLTLLWPLLEGAGTLALSAFLFKKRHKIAPLKAFRIYLFSYLILRFFLEFLRGDFIRGFIGPLSLPQWTSLALFCWVFLDSLLDKYHNKAHEIRSRRTRK
jgi:prolipoprotein diacylglyceryltransferase